ncbi:MAG: AAA family ATPase [Deltaproteobacteria bacterium]|nr:AAA family ATPase [Deltaproteobacteria bacterium]
MTQQADFPEKLRNMAMNPKNFLVTGPPGCGKSTVIEAVVRRINRPMTGFFTREIRERGRRRGFKIVTLAGKEGILARDNITGSVRVGRYGVNLDDLERIAVPSMIPSQSDQMVVIDEIGKMECYSSLFRHTLVRTLDSPHLVIGSISQKGGLFIQEIKNRADLSIHPISERNRDTLPDLLAQLLLEAR